MKTFYLVFPKMSAYEFKDINVQMYIENEAQKCVKQLSDMGFRVKCFAEDSIALEVIKDTDSVKWVTLLSENDAYYFRTSVLKSSEMCSRYISLDKTGAADVYITGAKEKFPLPKKSKEIDNEEYTVKRRNTLYSRLRYVAEHILEDCKFAVIFRSRGNDFCKLQDSYAGDGKFTMVVDLDYLMAFYEYGGVPLNEEQAGLVLRSVV